MRPADNPVYARLTAGARPPSLRLTVLGAIVIGAAGAVAVVTATAGLVAQGKYDVLFGLGARLELLIALQWIIPLVVAGAASILTVRFVTGEALDLLRITPISPRAVAEGCLGAALFRLRVPLGLLIAAAPALALGEYAMTTATLNLPFYLSLYGTPHYTVIFGLLLPDQMAAPILVSAVNSLCGSIGSWGLAVLAGALGVWAGLARRRMSALTLLGPFLAVLGMAILPVMIVVPVAVIGALIPAVLPWLLIRPALMLAGRAYERSKPA